MTMKLLLYSHSGVCKNDDSYDDMIACDNNVCAVQVPEGSWYCPDCQWTFAVSTLYCVQIYYVVMYNNIITCI